MREYLVIESSRKNTVFSTPEDQLPHGYIPRDAAEQILGRSMEGNQWFTVEESKALRASKEWRSEPPVKVGQVWQVVDARFTRHVLVKSVDENSCRIITVKKGGIGFSLGWKRTKGASERKAGLGRFNGKRGDYRYTEEA